MTPDRKGGISIFAAARSCSLDTVAVLLNRDPGLHRLQVFHRDKNGNLARIVAFYTAHTDISKYLKAVELEYVAADDTLVNQLTRAIEQHDAALVTEILEHDPHTIDQPNDDGQFPLHVAIQDQHLPIAILLLKAGASIESIGYHGWRPLQIAASLGNLELVQLCLSHNANVHFVSSTGQTALHKACSSNSIAVVRLLLQKGADPHLLNHRGMTPLHIAAHQNELEIARCLISEYGVDVSILGKGDSPSKWATRSGHYEMLEYLREEERKAKGGKNNMEKKTKRFERQHGQERVASASTSVSLAVREATPNV